MSWLDHNTLNESIFFLVEVDKKGIFTTVGCILVKWKKKPFKIKQKIKKVFNSALWFCAKRSGKKRLSKKTNRKMNKNEKIKKKKRKKNVIGWKKK